MTNIQPPAAGPPQPPIDRADHHKHMDFVQAVITRLANNSFLMKGWAVTLSSALIGFAISRQQFGVALAALIPIAAFWILDTYYLRQERAFRDIYRDVASKTLHNFEIDPRGYVTRHAWFATGRSISLSLFYAPLAVVTCVITTLLVLSGQTTNADTTPAPATTSTTITSTTTTTTTVGTTPPTNRPK